MIGSGMERCVSGGVPRRRYKLVCWMSAAINWQVNESPVISRWPAKEGGSGSSGRISMGWASLLPPFLLGAAAAALAAPGLATPRLLVGVFVNGVSDAASPFVASASATASLVISVECSSRNSLEARKMWCEAMEKSIHTQEDDRSLADQTDQHASTWFVTRWNSLNKSPIEDKFNSRKPSYPMLLAVWRPVDWFSLRIGWWSVRDVARKKGSCIALPWPASLTSVLFLSPSVRSIWIAGSPAGPISRRRVNVAIFGSLLWLRKWLA